MKQKVFFFLLNNKAIVLNGSRATAFMYIGEHYKVLWVEKTTAAFIRRLDNVWARDADLNENCQVKNAKRRRHFE